MISIIIRYALIITILFYFQEFLHYLHWFNFLLPEQLALFMDIGFFPSIYIIVLVLSSNKIELIMSTIKIMPLVILVIFLLMQLTWLWVSWIPMHAFFFWYAGIIMINVACFHIALTLFQASQAYGLVFVLYHWIFLYLTLQITHASGIPESSPMLLANFCYLLIFYFFTKIE